MTPFKLGIKHMASCLPDWHAEFMVDEASRLVTVHMDHFDSVPFADAVVQALPERGIHAYRDDSLGWHTPPAPYSLRIFIGTAAFDAQVVKLAISGRTTVSLTPVLAPGRGSP